MGKIFLYASILLCAVLLEATSIQIPFSLTLLIVFSVLEKRGWLLFLGFFAGLALDGLTFRTLGASSLFFVVALGLLFLYGKKFETHHAGFGAFFLAISALVNSFVFGNPHPFIATGLAVVIGVVMLLLLQFFDLHFVTKK